jgi:hypothetical protein
MEAYDIRNDVERVFKAPPQQQLEHVPPENLQHPMQEELEQLQEQLKNVDGTYRQQTSSSGCLRRTQQPARRQAPAPSKGPS